MSPSTFVASANPVIRGMKRTATSSGSCLDVAGDMSSCQSCWFVLKCYLMNMQSERANRRSCLNASSCICLVVKPKRFRIGKRRAVT